MTKSPDQIVADIDRKQNEEDLDLPNRVVGKAKELGGKAIDFGKHIATEAGKDIHNSVQLYKQGLGMKSEPLKDVKYKKGGTASARADGCAVKGKTKGTIIACTGGYMKGKK
jgi:hypothetical protein